MTHSPAALTQLQVKRQINISDAPLNGLLRYPQTLLLKSDIRQRILKMCLVVGATGALYAPPRDLTGI